MQLLAGTGDAALDQVRIRFPAPAPRRLLRQLETYGAAASDTFGREAQRRLRAICELASFLVSPATVEGAQIKSSACLFRYLRAQGLRAAQEQIWLLCLDRQGRSHAPLKVALGGRQHCDLDIAAALRHALLLDAQTLVLAHNHPSGSLEPSPDDDALTTQFSDAAFAVGLHLADHLIVTACGYFSYRDEGRLPLPSALRQPRARRRSPQRRRQRSAGKHGDPLRSLDATHECASLPRSSRR